jgi:hypothetical protein
MQPNRSVPAARVIPVLVYPDVRQAVDWLTAAFGFAERVRIGENHRSQLRFGDGALIVADVRRDRRPPRQGEVTHSVMVRVNDARAHCEQARGTAPGSLSSSAASTATCAWPRSTRPCLLSHPPRRMPPDHPRGPRTRLLVRTPGLPGSGARQRRTWPGSGLQDRLTELRNQGP